MWITQSACGGPCRGGSTRSPGLPGSASAAGIRAPARGAGCSAEKSACPWPRLSLLKSSDARNPPTKTLAGGTRPPLVSSCVSLASRRGLPEAGVAAVSPLSGDCTRVLTRFHWVKPGPARAKSRQTVDTSHSRHAIVDLGNLLPANVAERLAPEQKTVSFCQCRFDNDSATDNQAGMPTKSRAHSPQHHCDEPRPAAFSPVDNRATATVLSPQPVDNYVDRASSFIWSSPDRPQGGTRR